MLRHMETLLSFFGHVYKGGHFCDLLFASLEEIYLKGGSSLKQKLFTLWGQFFPLRIFSDLILYVFMENEQEL